MNENAMTGKEFAEYWKATEVLGLEATCDLAVKDVKVDDPLYKAALALSFAIEGFLVEFNKYR